MSSIFGLAVEVTPLSVVAAAWAMLGVIALVLTIAPPKAQRIVLAAIIAVTTVLFLVNGLGIPVLYLVVIGIVVVVVWMAGFIVGRQRRRERGENND
jgi:hypothetical protein